MTPDAAINDRDALRDQNDPRPVFLDGDFNNLDDLGDWWLDIGRIDLPA